MGGRDCLVSCALKRRGLADWLVRRGVVLSRCAMRFWFSLGVSLLRQTVHSSSLIEVCAVVV